MLSLRSLAHWNTEERLENQCSELAGDLVPVTAKCLQCQLKRSSKKTEKDRKSEEQGEPEVSALNWNQTEEGTLK